MVTILGKKGTFRMTSTSILKNIVQYWNYKSTICDSTKYPTITSLFRWQLSVLYLCIPPKDFLLLQPSNSLYSMLNLLYFSGEITGCRTQGKHGYLDIITFKMNIKDIKMHYFTHRIAFMHKTWWLSSIQDQTILHHESPELLHVLL